VAAWVRGTEQMIAEAKRHADAMATLQGKDDPQSKGAESKAYAEKVAAWQKERALLAEKPVELRKIDDRMAEETQKHNNKMLALNRQYFGQFNREAGSSAASVITGQETIGQAARQMFVGMTAAMITHFVEKKLMQLEDTLFSTASHKTEQMSAAALAGANMVASWSSAPWPVDAGAPAMGATAMAAAMAFSEGGIVPGVGRGDIVPAMLTPGEGVMPKPVMDGLKNQAEHGNMNGAVTTHIHQHTSPSWKWTRRRGGAFTLSRLTQNLPDRTKRRAWKMRSEGKHRASWPC
jgi:hypothetical protein